jgi:predicted esterase
MRGVFPEPTAAWRSPDDAGRPLVVLLHGRGADEQGILGLADHLPAGPSYVAVRAPIAEGGGYAWFANRGIGRPVAESLSTTMAWFRAWLDPIAPPARPVILVGFSGGAAFVGGLLLSEPLRFAGAAILYGTLPFEAGVPVIPARLAGVPVFVAQGEADRVIPHELLDRTWAYLLGESGAPTLARRDPGGHGLTADAVAELGGWIAERLSSSPAAARFPSDRPRGRSSRAVSCRRGPVPGQRCRGGSRRNNGRTRARARSRISCSRGSRAFRGSPPGSRPSRCRERAASWSNAAPKRRWTHSWCREPASSPTSTPSTTGRSTWRCRPGWRATPSPTVGRLPTHWPAFGSPAAWCWSTVPAPTPSSTWSSGSSARATATPRAP